MSLKEYWLDTYNNVLAGCAPAKPDEKIIHVVDYSDYEKLERSLANDGYQSMLKVQQKLLKERDKYREALKKINFKLCIPAAEYVPVIGEIFTIIDEVCGKKY